MELMDILVLAVVLIMVIGIAIALLVIVNYDKKEQTAQMQRCTIKTKGILLCVNQAASMNSESGCDDYGYYPVVQYEYNNRMYETEYKFESRLWSQVEANTSIDVFVNPADGNDIYISIPDEVREKNNKKNKYIVVFIMIWLIIGIIGIVLHES